MPNYCPRIHHGITISNITNTNLSYAACCWANENIVDKNINFFHPELQNIRTQNINGTLPKNYCLECTFQENVGKKSMRQGYAETHGAETYDNSIQYLDVNIDYTCNLACLTCGPGASTKWRTELAIKNVSVRPNIDKFIDRLYELDLSNLKEIRFWGGEPFLTHTHKKILTYISNRQDVSTVKLMYNTNGTCIIDNETKQLIEKFKFARISFSIDAVGKKFNYIRYPANWTKVEKNLFWWQENLPHNSMLSLTVTASILNVLYLNEVYNWQEKFFSESKFGDLIEIYTHQAFGDSALSNMPIAMAKELQSIPNYCQPWLQSLENLASNSIGANQFLDYLRKTDQRRQLYLNDALPEVAKFLNY
jgi:hypothetical protein